MNQEQIDRIDERLADWFANDFVLKGAIEEARQAGLPEIHVGFTLGKLLYLLTKLIGASKAVEIGTLGGFSGSWIARGLAGGGKLITIELEPRHAEIARKTFDAADVSDKVEIRFGNAVELTQEGSELRRQGPYDLVFIDADKDNYPAYLDFALATVRSGGLILADNLIRSGSALDLPSEETCSPGVVEYNRRVSKEPRLEAVVIPALKDGIDGLGIARVR